MASDGKDGLIDLENLVRDLDSPEGQAAPVASEPQGDSAPGRLASAAESVDSSLRPTGGESETLTASPVKKSNQLDESAEPNGNGEGPSESNKTSSIEAANLSEEDVDSLLLLESPEMAVEVSQIREVAKTPFEGGDATEEIDDVLKADAEVGIWPRVNRRLNVVLLKLVALVVGVKSFAIRMVRDSKGVLLELVAQTKVGLRTSFINRKAQLGLGWKWFVSRTILQRLSIVAAFCIAVLAGGVVYKLYQGTLLPPTKREWIASFVDHADAVFLYEANEPMEDFNDPILHPEFVVTIERVVVNLRRTPEAESGSNPMAAFEFFIQADSQVGAIEVKDRNIEIRDQIARAVEQMTYSDLATDAGKTRLKLVLRKQLNEIMTKGRVRRVYFKTIVLNPE